MTQNSLVDALLDDFFPAVNHRNLKKCQAILAKLNELATMDADVQPWAQYCRGILLFEVQRDWVAAERVFTGMLQSDLPPEIRTRVLYAVGRTYIVQGHWQLAIDAYDRLQAVAATLEQPNELIKAHRQTAIAYYRGYVAGDFDVDVLHLAVEQCRTALSLLMKLEGQDNTRNSIWLAGSVWSNLGVIYFNLQEWDRALDCYQHDLDCCHQLDDRHGLGLTLNNMGEVYHQRADNAWGTALSFYLQALASVREFGNAYEELDVLRNLGQLHCDMDEFNEACRRYQQAIDLIERLRTNVSSSEGRTGFFSTVVATYANMVDLLIRRGDIGRAFDMTERARSRTFIEMLAERPDQTIIEIPPQLTAQEKELRTRLQHLHATNDRQTAIDLETELAEVQRQIHLLTAKHHDLHNIAPLTHRQIQRQLPPTTALLAYFNCADELLLFVFTRNALTVQSLALTLSQLPRAFDAQGHLHRLTPGPDGQLHKPWLLDQLHTYLIAPISDQLEGIERLILLPWGPLHFVPFAALTAADEDGNAQALMDRFEILYAPSATVLFEHCQRKSSPSTTAIMAVGYNGVDLRYAEAEAAAVAVTPDSVAMVEKAATRQMLLDGAANVRWLHLSCHGRFNAHAPLTSHLLLADGPLYATDILQTLKLDAELVTLSACETGRSQVLRGEELIGLVRAFLTAGAAAVLVTLWPVDEISTVLLMVRFYANLRAGQSKTKALRDAQNYLRRLARSDVIAALDKLEVQSVEEIAKHLPGSSKEEKIFAHPYYWASFILMGDRIEPITAD